MNRYRASVIDERTLFRARECMCRPERPQPGKIGPPCYRLVCMCRAALCILGRQPCPMRCVAESIARRVGPCGALRGRDDDPVDDRSRIAYGTPASARCRLRQQLDSSGRPVGLKRERHDIARHGSWPVAGVLRWQCARAALKAGRAADLDFERGCRGLRVSRSLPSLVFPAPAGAVFLNCGCPGLSRPFPSPCCRFRGCAFMIRFARCPRPHGLGVRHTECPASPLARFRIECPHLLPRQSVARQKERLVDRYVCIMCGYLHDEEKEGTPFDELPDDYVCPECGEGKEAFRKVDG